MKIKLLDESPFVEGYNVEGLSIKDSKSFIIIKNNVVEYFERHKVPFGHLQQDDNPVIINPFSSFKVKKLTKDTYKEHMYSSYQIKIDFVGLNNHWYFVDLNCLKKLRLDFNANNTILNKSNIHQLIYGVFGGIIGAYLLRLFFGSY
jgi:hypothetical protein